MDVPAIAAGLYPAAKLGFDPAEGGIEPNTKLEGLDP